MKKVGILVTIGQIKTSLYLLNQESTHFASYWAKQKQLICSYRMKKLAF